MSVLVVGLSRKSAPVATLERAAVSGDTLAKLLVDLAAMFGVGATIGALNGRSTVRMGCARVRRRAGRRGDLRCRPPHRHARILSRSYAPVLGVQSHQTAASRGRGFAGSR